MANKIGGLPFQKASAEELQKAQQRVSIPSMKHLKAWMLGTNRGYVIFRGSDLIDALDSVPNSAETFQQLVNIYTSHRLTQPTGDVKEFQDPSRHLMAREPIFKDDRLTTEELDQCIRQLTREMYDRDPEWKL